MYRNVVLDKQGNVFVSLVEHVSPAAARHGRAPNWIYIGVLREKSRG